MFVRIYDLEASTGDHISVVLLYNRRCPYRRRYILVSGNLNDYGNIRLCVRAPPTCSVLELSSARKIYGSPGTQQRAKLLLNV